MISRRNKRPASPQERPKQFAINNSAGIDFNKPSTDPDSVQLIKNLTVNLDGSVSLRKRLRPVHMSHTDVHGEPIAVLYTGKHILWRAVDSSGAVSYSISHRDPVKDELPDISVRVVTSEYYYPDRTVLHDEYRGTPESPIAISVSKIDLESATFQNTGSSTVICNAKVSTDFLAVGFELEYPNPGSPLDPKLYATLPAFVPRYLQVSIADDGVFEMRIMQPELTVLNPEEGAIPLNPNLALDNPYAIRDKYFGGACRILGLLPYWAPEPYVSEKTCTVACLTEQASRPADSRPAVVPGVPDDHINYAIKAFCQIPGKFASDPVCFWEYTFDNVRWVSIDLANVGPGTAYAVLNPNADDAKWENPDQPTSKDLIGQPYSKYVEVKAYTLSGWSSNELLESRADVLLFRHFNTQMGDASNVRPAAVRFSVALTPDSDGPTVSEQQYPILTVFDTATYNLSNAGPDSPLTTTLPNATLGDKLYYKKSMYSFGTSDFENVVLRSDPGSAITPMYNALDLDTTAGAVSCVVPWRDYLMSFTETAIYLSSVLDDGFLTKTLSAYMGVPMADRYGVQPTLNGIIFKSGTKVYMAYPNLYSGDDTYITFTELSKPIAHVLENLPTPELVWSTSDSDAYTLLLTYPGNADGAKGYTVCLRYFQTNRTWEYYEYPICFERFFKDITGVVTGVDSTLGVEYALFEELPCIETHVDDTTGIYADTLVKEIKKYAEVKRGTYSSPITFELDTGSKTDSLTTVKQFVESRILISTEDDAENIPIHVTVAIDGDPHITTVDVNTDAPFYMDDTSKGIAGTAFRLTSGDPKDPDEPPFGRQSSGILRQLSVRYSGRGRAVRHILTGASNSNFKLYEIYIKYKPIRY